MSSVTLASLRTVVRTRGDFPTSAKHTSTFLDLELQTSWAELHELIEDCNEGFWDTSSTTPTIANQAYVALPVAAWKIKGVDILDGAEYSELAQVGTSDRNRFGSTTDQPRAYRLTERGIDLFPTPNAVYTIRITYARVVTALSESTATTIPNDWQDYVAWSTILKLNTTERRDSSESMAMVQATRARIIAGASKRRQQEPEYIPLRERAPDWWG